MVSRNFWNLRSDVEYDVDSLDTVVKSSYSSDSALVIADLALLISSALVRLGLGYPER